MAEILAAQTAAGTSSSFTISSPVAIQMPGLAGGEYGTLEYQYNSSGSWYPVNAIGIEGRIENQIMPLLLVAPGTYRVTKTATAVAVPIAYEE